MSSIIFALESGWQRTGAYHFVRAEPGNEWDGDYWRTNQDERVGIVLGFLACEFAEGKAVSGRPGQELVSWVDQFYGVDPTGKNPDQLGPRYKEKLSTAIMAAERALP